MSRICVVIWTITGLQAAAVHVVLSNASDGQKHHDRDKDRHSRKDLDKSGANKFRVDPGKMIWSTHAPAASNNIQPSDQSSNGTFGRFRYIPSKNVFVVTSSIDENVFFYKLSPGGGVVDTIAPEPPTSLESE